MLDDPESLPAPILEPVRATINGELRFDAMAISGSLILLLVLLSISLERILGLDRFILKLFKRRASEKSASNRQALEALFDKETRDHEKDDPDI